MSVATKNTKKLGVFIPEFWSKKLNKKLKGKTIVIYGSGLLFQKVLSNYDLSELNIIGISDRKFSHFINPV